MKHVLIIPDGCADEPLEELGGKTPLEFARTPNMDRIAKLGVVEMTHTIPASMPAGTDVGTMSLLGYDPKKFHTGRAPIEVAARNIEIGENDWAFRCNFVTIIEGRMESFSAGELPEVESQKFLKLLKLKWTCEENWDVHSGFGYRNLAIFRGDSLFDRSTVTTPPHNITGQTIDEFLPRGAGADELKRLMQQSEEVFRDCEFHRELISAQKLPVTGIWLWGQGKKTRLEPFDEMFGKSAAMISAVDLPKGLATLAGMDVVDVVGATGTVDTNYTAKGDAAIRALREYDLVVVHIEATDQASHEGNVKEKITALEEIDRHIVGPIHEALQNTGNYRIMIVPDHATLIRTKTHSAEPVPFTLCGAGIDCNSCTSFNELAASRSSPIRDGHELMTILLNRK